MSKSPNDALLVIVLADGLKDQPSRDQSVSLMIQEPANPPKAKQLFLLLRDWFAEGPHADLDVKRDDEVYATFAPQGRGVHDFLLWRLLENRGQSKQAKVFLERCAKNKETLATLRLAALSAIRDAGEKIDP